MPSRLSPADGSTQLLCAIRRETGRSGRQVSQSWPAAWSASPIACCAGETFPFVVFSSRQRMPARADQDVIGHAGGGTAAVVDVDSDDAEVLADGPDVFLQVRSHSSPWRGGGTHQDAHLPRERALMGFVPHPRRGGVSPRVRKSGHRTRLPRGKQAGPVRPRHPDGRRVTWRTRRRLRGMPRPGDYGWSWRGLTVPHPAESGTGGGPVTLRRPQPEALAGRVKF